MLQRFYARLYRHILCKAGRVVFKSAMSANMERILTGNDSLDMESSKNSAHDGFKVMNLISLVELL